MRRVILGAVVGVAVSVIVAGGNRAPHTISMFPDGLALFLFIALHGAAIWLELRRSRVVSFAEAFQVARTIGIVAGCVFGASFAMLVIARFTHPSVVMIGLSASAGFFASVICACGASAIAWKYRNGFRLA